MAAEKQLHLYGAIQKFDVNDDGSLLVSGIASTESVDAQGETVTADCMRKALPAYLQSGAVREMHQPIAAGRPIAAHVDDDGKTHFTAHVVDAGTVEKVKTGILKGFSIGGKSIRKVGNIIHEILLKEISLVDLPCNSECTFSVIKFDKPDEKHKDDCDCADCKKSKAEKLMSAELIQKVDSLAEMVKTLAATVKTLSEQKPALPDLTKFETALVDLQKRADESAAKLVDGERVTIIHKMKSEARVIIGEDGLGVKEDDLKKMDLPLLKALSRNAQALPTIAKATYTGTGDGPDETQFTKVDRSGKTVKLEGSELIQKGWEHLTIEKMIAAGTTAGLK